MAYITEEQLGAETGAALVGFTQFDSTSGHNPNAVPRTLLEKARDVKSVADWGAKPDGVISATALRAAVGKAWTDALAGGFDLHFPAGVYDIGEYSFPWTISGTATALLDCKDITIHGDGPATVFKTTSEGGADVFQLNSVKNLHFRNLKITAELTGFMEQGSNGVSLTGGFDNITILDVWIENLPSLDKGNYVSGGKALSFQSAKALLEVGSLKARIFAKGCAQGFGFESDLVNLLGKKVAVDVDLVAEDCFVAVVMGAAPVECPSPPAPCIPIPAGTHAGVRVRAQAINCQKDVHLGRIHGVEVACQTITTKEAADRRLDANGVPWYADDPIVEALQLNYAKNSQIRITGNKGQCDYKARIGGSDAGTAGLSPATEHCDIFLDIGGDAGISEISEIEYGAYSLARSQLTVTATTGTIPLGFYLPSRENLLISGTKAYLCGPRLQKPQLDNPRVTGDLELADPADEDAVVGQIRINGSNVEIRQVASSVPGNWNLRIKDDANGQVFGFRQDGGISTKAATAGGPAGAVVGKVPFYDDSNTLIGFAELKALETQ